MLEQNNVSTPSVSDIKITIINLKNEINAPLVEKLRAKFGPVIDEMTLFAFQNGSELIMHKYHEKQKKFFLVYPSFNAIISLGVNLYLKQKGESFPSQYYKIKKSDVESTLMLDEINAYVNTSLDLVEEEKFLSSPIRNEAILGMDNLKTTIVLTCANKEKRANNILGETTYAMLYDVIRSKTNDVFDSNYLDLLNKTSVMFKKTFKNPADFGNAIEISSPKKESKPKVVKEKVEKEKVEKEKVEKEKFVAPEVVPVLENINDESVVKNDPIDESIVEKVLNEIK